MALTAKKYSDLGSTQEPSLYLYKSWHGPKGFLESPNFTTNSTSQITNVKTRPWSRYVTWTFHFRHGDFCELSGSILESE